jgi:hypothetical protein
VLGVTDPILFVFKSLIFQNRAFAAKLNRVF